MSYVANTPSQRQTMLKACGAASIDDLFVDIPASLRAKPLRLPCPKSEMEIYQHLRDLAARNYSHLTVFLGGGFYDHFIPAAVDALVSRSEFYTAYTPYQPELAQGTLQALYEYQTHICRLTGMDAFTLHPMAGAHGELTGMMIVAAYHRDKGNRKTEVVIPDEAHGTNPSSAATAGYTTRPVPTDPTTGMLDLEALDRCVGEQTAAIMLTNPNTLGIFNTHIDKALIDKGFHPPTVYFPLIVKEALMIEPTETESKEVLDAFVAAMKEIAQHAHEEPSALQAAPTTTPICRPDEVRAARDADLAFEE